MTFSNQSSPLSSPIKSLQLSLSSLCFYNYTLYCFCCCFFNLLHREPSPSLLQFYVKALQESVSHFTISSAKAKIQLLLLTATWRLAFLLHIGLLMSRQKSQIASSACAFECLAFSSNVKELKETTGCCSTPPL